MRLGNASTEEQFNAALNNFQATEIWMGNANLQRYVRSIWLPKKKVHISSLSYSMYKLSAEQNTNFSWCQNACFDYLLLLYHAINTMINQPYTSKI